MILVVMILLVTNLFKDLHIQDGPKGPRFSGSPNLPKAIAGQFRGCDDELLGAIERSKVFVKVALLDSCTACWGGPKFDRVGGDVEEEHAATERSCDEEGEE